MIAVEFWGVKARKPQYRRNFAAALMLSLAQVFLTLIRFCMERNCTRPASCVKFTTNKSFARQNRKKQCV